MATREQLQSAVILCNSQEEHVEIIQLTLSDYSMVWQTKATRWCQQAIQSLQQNAIVLDSLLEQVDEGGVVDKHLIPPTPAEYNRLLTLEKHKEKMEKPTKWFKEAVESGDSELVNLLLEDERVEDASINYNWAFRNACEHGHLAIVDRLLQDTRVDPSSLDNYAIRMASLFNHLDIIGRLLQEPWDPRIDPSVMENYAIRVASRDGNLAIVDRLLQDDRVGPSAYANYAIRIASFINHPAIVDRLLQDPRVDPSANFNEALKVASQKRLSVYC
jgi:hypothetical protein